MLDWLSSWLKDVVAVVLLAALVDLLLPNQRMQRYARLVTGLIVLLVILTPLLRLVQGDFQARLETGYREWNRELERSQVKMPSLDEILRQAEIAAGRSGEQAVALARTQLETGIREAVERDAGAEVREVSAAVDWDGQGGGEIRSVTVLLAAAPDGGAQPVDEGAADAAAGSDSIEPVVPVDPVDIRLKEPEAQEAMAGLEEAAARKADARLEGRIRRIVAEGWPITPDQVSVELEPAGGS
ncbi:stage III sporulation protein AF [Paenibacillus albicereus]|uniref:Stage III sporulation protein AF n=1 Tax=Paenibacillus albicereus TaxID=2726185 RepID=A0A6H2GWP3_9BACL|nr:stage III sporulation protein AF [Paenibacillus albicereus]QJC51779.1 stage III sporulation protein AF [Paenibacillus albicereus]